jgi:hypothetical protein
MTMGLLTDDEIKGVIDQLLPEDVRMVRRLDLQESLQDGVLTFDEKRVLQKLARHGLAELSSQERDKQWIPSSNVKKALRIWNSLGKQDDDDAPQIDPSQPH